MKEENTQGKPRPPSPRDTRKRSQNLPAEAETPEQKPNQEPVPGQGP